MSPIPVNEEANVSKAITFTPGLTTNVNRSPSQLASILRSSNAGSSVKSTTLSRSRPIPPSDALLLRSRAATPPRPAPNRRVGNPLQRAQLPLIVRSRILQARTGSVRALASPSHSLVTCEPLGVKCSVYTPISIMHISSTRSGTFIIPITWT